jgi:hypothetical protein
MLVMDKIKPFYLYNDRNKKCSSCSITSTNVEKSKKYNILLCMDCLKDKILSDTHSSKD